MDYRGSDRECYDESARTAPIEVKERALVLVRIIRGIRSLLQLNEISEEKLFEMAREWNIPLRDIPTEMLYECYVIASKEVKSDKYNVWYAKILEVYDSIKARNATPVYKKLNQSRISPPDNFFTDIKHILNKKQ